MDNVAPSVFSLRKAGWRETSVFMALAWLVPFLVHLIPWSGPRPLGVYLLPLFWTSFVALYLYGVRIGLIVALTAPAINLLTTGRPAAAALGLNSLELTVFVLVAGWAVRRRPKLDVTAPLAYLPAKAVSVLLVAAIPAVFHESRPLLSHFVTSLISAVPGLGVLLLLNLLLVALVPPSEDWDSV